MVQVFEHASLADDVPHALRPYDLIFADVFEGEGEAGVLAFHDTHLPEGSLADDTEQTEMVEVNLVGEHDGLAIGIAHVGEVTADGGEHAVEGRPAGAGAREEAERWAHYLDMTPREGRPDWKTTGDVRGGRRRSSPGSRLEVRGSRAGRSSGHAQRSTEVKSEGQVTPVQYPKPSLASSTIPPSTTPSLDHHHRAMSKAARGYTVSTSRATGTAACDGEMDVFLF
nr:hypothetical protein CFP56_76310 [Quercus suber]